MKLTEKQARIQSLMNEFLTCPTQVRRDKFYTDLQLYLACAVIARYQAGYTLKSVGLTFKLGNEKNAEKNAQRFLIRYGVPRRKPSGRPRKNHKDQKGGE